MCVQSGPIRHLNGCRNSFLLSFFALASQPAPLWTLARSGTFSERLESVVLVHSFRSRFPIVADWRRRVALFCFAFFGASLSCCFCCGRPHAMILVASAANVA